ncbi:uncharacterized protein LOC133489262 isoform X2 [Phyllopteryx taeniolatus]|uniref:uncharacterized protein LOC133489262 isoform X2 n=1 Tax=Phyllopteryx taeniolatus TaxID=161469 RepID=UPI002AD32D86|nr:uncharacterized protein LOC133489262 isoform X2 [Phyllopteryx taeniolatus]
MAMPWLYCLHVAFICFLCVADFLQSKSDLCDSSCAAFPTSDKSYQKGVRYTYRYRTAITTSLHGSNAGRNGLVLDCVVDIDVVSKCHLMMQIRNPQMKWLSPQKEHSVPHLKSLRESLERTPVKFSLLGGKIFALCIQEGEQVWTLNIKRAFLSMLQTSHTASKHSEMETDVHGTCTSLYERQGPLLLKTRFLKQCHQLRLAHFWTHSEAVTGDTSVQSELRCVQAYGSAVMEEVNCTETVSIATWSKTSGQVKTQTESTLLLLRAQPGTVAGTDSLYFGTQTDLPFEDEGAARPRNIFTPQVSQTIRMLCSVTSRPQEVSHWFLQLAFQLRELTVPQLKTLWQEMSFKCRNDWQPLLDALPACGSENCIILLTDLMKGKELEDEQAHSFLTTIGLIPNPSPQIIHSLNTLVDVQEVRDKALLAGSSLIHQLCHQSTTPCIDLPQVQTFIQTLEQAVKEGCEPQSPTKVKELTYAMKSVGNMGLAASTFIPLLNHYGLNHSVPLELRLVAIKAFRRFDCSANRTLLLQLYSSSLEAVEVRIAAYQELMRCPDQDVFEAVKVTLRNEKSSQVGSFVWSHLTNILRSDDPMKQTLIDSLPDDIISRDFEADFLKYSSYSDYTTTNGLGITNVETTVIFSPKSFLPSTVSINLTVYFHGRASNLLEVDLHIENAQPLLKSILGQLNPSKTGDPTSSDHSASKEATKTRRKINEEHREEKDLCLSSSNSYLKQARALLSTRKKMEEDGLKCWVGVKVFGNELSVFTCDDLYAQIKQMSLSAAGLAVKLLKGHEVQFNHKAVLLTEELVLPSLSGLPVKIATNMTSFLSLRLKGNINYRDTSHFSLAGYIKPNGYVGLTARMGVDGTLGHAAVEWMSELVSSTSLDGSVHMQEGQDLRVTLNTPEEAMDIVSLSSRVFQLSGDRREEMKGPKCRIQQTTCTPKTWSKMVGWQLCANASYPLASGSISLPPSGPTHLSVRLLKLDRGLHYYLLEAAFSMDPLVDSWFPKEASIHLLLATPKSSIPRDMSLDLAFNPRRFLLRLSHPLKSILVQGELEQERSIKSAKLELTIDGVHYYVMGLVDKQTLISELRTRYHFEAKMAANRNPIILSANVTRGVGKKMSFSATVKNVFGVPASLSVALERRRDSHSRQYSLEVELFLPGVVGSRMLGLVEQKGLLWSSALRLKYGLGGDARHLHRECHTSQSVKSERHANLTYIVRADHEFYCSNTPPINHKIYFRHEESQSHVKSSVDMSYGKHWDEINNKHTLLMSQSFKNQSTQNHTSYTLEFNFQVPEKDLNYRTQLLHSYLRQLGSESSTHLKINYNNLTPLVAGIHWKSPPNDNPHKKWEATFNMDTPWLYIYTTHKLSKHHRHTLQLNSELTANKWVTVRNLVLEASYRDRGREKEARLKLHTPAVTFLQLGGLGFMGKKNMKTSWSLSSLWTAPLRGDISLEMLKSSLTLQMSSSYSKQNITVSAALNTIDKLLKKRQAILRVSLLDPKSRPTEFEFEGTMEELKKDKNMYQKTALLHLRQPFKTFPQKLLLRETFTVDLLKGLYILESRAGFYSNKEINHTLTVGYKLPSPFVCSALIHPFNTETFPSDSEICLTMSSNQTQKDIQGRLRVSSQEKLSFFGQIIFNSLHTSQQALRVRTNITHQLQLQIPSFALMEGDVCWSPKNNTDFDYLLRGRLKIERQECQLSMQLNGTSDRILLYSSLRHPFKSKIPKSLEAKATADMSAPVGRGSSSVRVKADGKDRLMLDAQISHSLLQEDKTMLLRLNLSQSLLHGLTDLYVKMAANVSRHSVSLHGSYREGRNTLLAQMKGSLKNSSGLQLAVSGKMRHSMANLAILPCIMGLDGILGLSDTITEGQVRVRVEETFFSMDLRHQEEKEELSDMLETKVSFTRSWMCVLLGAENFCVNVSRQLGKKGTGEVYIQLSHSSHQLNATGLPTSSSVQVSWDQDESGLSALAELQAGPEHLKAEFNGSRTNQLVPRWEILSRLQHRVKALHKRGISSSMQATAHCQINSTGLDTGLFFHTEEKKMIDALLVLGSKNNTAVFRASLQQQIKLLQGIIPVMLQMNCTGDMAADHLSAQCYGDVAGRPVETLLPSQTSMNITVNHSGCSTNLSIDLLAPNEQKGSMMLLLTFQPSLSLNASVQHSIEAIHALGFPSNAALVLTVSATHLPVVNVGLEIGNCHFSGHLDKTESSEAERKGFSCSVNVAHYCPVLQGTFIPVTMVLKGSLSGFTCKRVINYSVKADNQYLSFELRECCSSPHLSATLTHTFTGLSSRGIPQMINVEATAPGGAEKTGALFIKAGDCQGQLNGSVWQESEGKWAAVVDANLDGKRSFLQLVAQSWPELRVEGELRHKLTALGNFPELSKIIVIGKLGKQQYATEALVLFDECAVRARGFVMSRSSLEGSLVYHNNCSVIQDWGSPDMMQAFGSFIVTPTLAESQLNLAIDNAELHSSVGLKKTKEQSEVSLNFNHTMPVLKRLGLTTNTEMSLSSGNYGNQSYYSRIRCSVQNQKFNQEMTMEKAFQTVTVKSHFRHTMNYLYKMGVPGNSSIQVAILSSEEKTLSVNSRFGHQQAGLRLNIKCFPMTKEIRAITWHSFTWLQQRGIPRNIEGLCSTQGMSSQLQSRAQFTVDGHKQLDSGVNVSWVDGHLAVLLSYSPSPSNQTWKWFSLNTAVTAQFKGSMRSISVYAHNQDWRVRLVADVAGWGLQEVSKEARITLKHTKDGDSSPAFQVEAWGRISGSQLKCSMAVNPELMSSLAIIVQGHHLPNSKDLLVKVVQSIPKMQIYLPSQLNFRSQFNQSQSSVGGLLEVLSGKRRLWTLGELAVIDSGCRQSLELKHSYPQLKLLPRIVAVKTVYEARNWSYQVQHAALWGKQEFSLSGLYTAPPSLASGNQTLKVQIKCRPRLTSLEVTLERSFRGRLDSVSLGWMRHGRLEQVRALSSWSQSKEMNETKLELNQPFSSSLSRLSLHTLSHSSEKEQRSIQQTHLSWSSGKPVNISISLNKRWHLNSSREQACALLSTQTILGSPVKGCVSVSQEGSLFSQNAELRWDNRSVKQGMKYQKGARGMHSLHVNIGLDKVSPAPCPSQSVLTKIQTNLRDRFEYTVLLALCPPLPTLSWSGCHMLHSGEELFYTQSRLSVMGQPNLCSLTLTLTNSSTAQSSNVTLFTESRMGNWSVEVGGSILSWLQGSGLLVRARLDHREELWLNSTMEGICFQTTAGYKNGSGLSEDVSVVACLGPSQNFILDVQKGDGSSQRETLGSLSVVAANQRLTLRARGCVESLTALEVRIQAVSSQIRNKLSERIKTMKNLLAEFRQQSRDTKLLQDLSAMPLLFAQQAESLLGHRGKSLLALWYSSSLRHIVTTSLPQRLSLLQHTLLLGQLELRRPLATLAGVYQDVKGQRLETVWREAVVLWADKVLQASPALLESPQLRPLAQGSMVTLKRAMDFAGQHTYHWVENKLAVAFSGLRKQLASLYKYSPSECSVAVSMSLPPLRWTRVAEAGLVGILLEEWLLKPLQSLTSIRPTAELYRLKRKIMDGPFNHQALLVADQFVVTFDGHLYELPGSYPLLLAQDTSADPSFTLLLNSHPHNLLLLRMNNSTVSIQRNGQVKVRCNNSVTHTWQSDGGVTVQRGSHIVQVSNHDGVSVSCDLRLEVCSLTLDGWLHGTSTGLLGTNDNEAGNDSPLRDGSQAKNMKEFFYSWQMNSECAKPTAKTELVATRAMTCDFLFSSPDSPLSSCFRVVDPGQFSLICVSSSSAAPCRLVSAYVHLCQHNYVPLEVPIQCMKG